MNSIVEQIIELKKKELEQSKAHLSDEEIAKETENFSRKVRPFKNAIQGKKNLSLVAEIKQASPSRGVIRKDFNPVDIAKVYQLKEASAISVLTEENFFKGSLEILRQVKEAVQLPILRKDFIFDTYQIYESFLSGADCVLLIVKILPGGLLSRLFNLTRSLGMSALVEVHTERELEAALRINADIIGVNNRNLDDFSCDMEIARRLSALVPKDKIVVVESGICSNVDIQLIRTYGVDAVLIGEAFLKEPDIATAMDNIWY